MLKPNLDYSRKDIDFGSGFYLTKDYSIAQKGACAKIKSIVSKYILDLSNLRAYHFKLDEEWLIFVTNNRMFKNNHLYDKYDVLIGPTVDDKLYDTLQDYLDGYLTVQQTLQYLNIAGASDQIVLKSNKAIDQLSYLNSYEIPYKEKQKIRKIALKERKDVIKKLEFIKKAAI